MPAVRRSLGRAIVEEVGWLPAEDGVALPLPHAAKSRGKTITLPSSTTANEGWLLPFLKNTDAIEIFSSQK